MSHDKWFLDRCVDHVLVLERQTITVMQGNFTSWQEQKAKRDACALAETTLIQELSELNDKLFAAIRKLESDLSKIDKDDVKPASQSMAHTVVPDMEELRRCADAAEKLTASAVWPYPSYSDMLYRVK